MSTLDIRLRTICDLSLPEARRAGRHEYDGQVQDLSPDGVRRGLAALARPETAARAPDSHDEAHLTAAEEALRVRFGELELHRVNPLWHLDNLDLTCYDREYAPAEERAAARQAHLGCWPDAVDAAIEALDLLPAPVATATLPTARALAAGAGEHVQARRAMRRLVAHLERAEADNPIPAALGGTALTRMLSAEEAIEVDLADLTDRAYAEQHRMLELLHQSCKRVDDSATTEQTVHALLADHPPADLVVARAKALAAQARSWTAQHALVPYDDGDCHVIEAPESRRYAMAALVGAAPDEPDAPSLFLLTPPDSAWPRHEQQQWLSLFSPTFLPAMVVHEVSPGHFSHSRAMRRVPGDVRRTLRSDGFTEGWAVYVEQLALEEGFRAHDPRFAVGIALSALQRASRLICSIGLHTGAMSIEEATHEFAANAYLTAPAARAEANRAMYHPTYGNYTWGKIAILELREQAKTRWGTGFSLTRFHTALLGLGAPPLGLIGNALEQPDR
jgi:hypothetical protein